MDDNFDYLYTRNAKHGTGFDVMGVGTYEESSVLAGQARIVFIDSYETQEECWEHYPMCRFTHHGAFTEPQNYFDHLEGEDL